MAKTTRGGVTVDTTGLDKLLKRLQILERKEIRWGFFSGSRYGPENDNMYVASIAKLQEDGGVGGSGRTIPSRPFFTTHALRVITPSDHVGSKFLTLLGAAVKSTMTGGTDASAYAAVGKHLHDSLQEEIIAWSAPENAPMTIKIKRFNDPLIHTGTMLESVEYKIVQRRKVDVDA